MIKSSLLVFTFLILLSDNLFDHRTNILFCNFGGEWLKRLLFFFNISFSLHISIHVGFKCILKSDVLFVKLFHLWLKFRSSDCFQLLFLWIIDKEFMDVLFEEGMNMLKYFSIYCKYTWLIRFSVILLTKSEDLIKNFLHFKLLRDGGIVICVTRVKVLLHY